MSSLPGFGVSVGFAAPGVSRGLDALFDCAIACARSGIREGVTLGEGVVETKPAVSTMMVEPSGLICFLVPSGNS